MTSTASNNSASGTTGTPGQPTIAELPITDDEIFLAHVGGKLSVELRSPIDTQRDLSIAYTPGVAQVSRAIAAETELVNKYTWTERLVAVVSDGSAVLGLGDIGPRASLPVMEGKSALFRSFAGLNSIPIVLDTKDPDEIVETLIRLRPSFGAVNLEDISAPRCFEIERRVIEALDCPVMHDDQHGTAIVTLAALRGAVQVLGRDIREQKVVISGAGAAGVACANILLAAGVTDIVVLDSKGIVSLHRKDLNEFKEELAERTNPRALQGGAAEALAGAERDLALELLDPPGGKGVGLHRHDVLLVLVQPDVYPARNGSVSATAGTASPFAGTAAASRLRLCSAAASRALRSPSAFAAAFACSLNRLMDSPTTSASHTEPTWLR